MKARRKQPPSPLHGPAKSSEREKEYLAEKNLRQFSELTAIELGKALGALVGELDYALLNPSPTVRERSMHVALNAAQEAMTLTRNLRYFSVQSRLDAHLVDLSQVVLDTVDLVEKEFALRKIQFKIFAEASTYVTIDPNAIQQALLNVFLHSAEQMRQGGNLTVVLKDTGRNIEIRISDNAPAASFSETLSDPTSVPGSGSRAVARLGLNVARTLIEAHGGDFIVQSHPEAGNAATFVLPFPEDNAQPEPFPHERRFRRIKIQLPVELTFLHGQNRLQTDVTVISEGGCYARLPEAKLMRLPEINESVALRIFYFSEQAVEIQRARIASVCWAGSLSGIGIDFVDVGDRAQKVLQALVKAHCF